MTTVFGTLVACGGIQTISAMLPCASQCRRGASMGDSPLEHDPIKVPVLSVRVVAIGLVQQTTVVPHHQIA